jgi:hypothetical protein
MKLKIMLLLGVFAAGAYASLALADEGKKSKTGEDAKCHEVHISGTVAPQTLVVTVDKASAKSLIAAGSTLNLAVGATGQTVRLKAEACATGTAGALTFTVKQVQLRPAKAKAAEETSTRKKGDDEHKGKDKGGTTTVGTTTTAPPTTTTTP